MGAAYVSRPVFARRYARMAAAHVRAHGRGAAAVQVALDRPVWPLLGGGCHAARDTVAAIAAAGFEVTRLERFRFPDVWLPQPTTPQVLGTAVRR